MKQVLIFLAEGFEEIEAITPLDLLRRVGVDAKFVSVTGNPIVTGAHGISYRADMLLDADCVRQADMLVLPGGMPGAQNLQDHAELGKLLKEASDCGKFVCAICAAPMVLGHLGLLQGKKATIYPGMEDRLTDATAVHKRVCRDGHIITARAPGTAIDFTLALVAALEGKEIAQGLKESIVYD